jgi:hypothetical protein
VLLHSLSRNVSSCDRVIPVALYETFVQMCLELKLMVVLERPDTELGSRAMETYQWVENDACDSGRPGKMIYIAGQSSHLGTVGRCLCSKFISQQSPIQWKCSKLRAKIRIAAASLKHPPAWPPL